jgi:hypothetical protein
LLGQQQVACLQENRIREAVPDKLRHKFNLNIMKKLKLTLGGTLERLSKEQMRKITGGYGNCGIWCFDDPSVCYWPPGDTCKRCLPDQGHVFGTCAE